MEQHHLQKPDQPATLASSIHDLLSGQDKIDVAQLPKNFERVCSKKGFDFNLLIAGNYQLGQRELAKTLFGVELANRDHLSLEEGKGYVADDRCELTEGSVNLRLNILTTPNFGMRCNEEHSYRKIVSEVKERLRLHLMQDEQLYRSRDMKDSRIHLCIYMLSPAGLPIHPVDYELMKRLCNICNVVPVIARADHMTLGERKVRKLQILEALEELKLNTFQLPRGDPNLDEDQWVDHLEKISERQPFAVMCNNEGYFDNFLPHNYDALDPGMSDTTTLRDAIIAHMKELVDNTNFEHYENFRADIKKLERSQSTKIGSIHFDEFQEIDPVELVEY